MPVARMAAPPSPLDPSKLATASPEEASLEVDVDFDEGPASWSAAASAPAPAAAPALTLEEIGPGVVVAGRYRIENVIGHGGMGAIWRAHDLTFSIDVALKLIRSDRIAPETRGRLLQEARAAARIGHPSIVRIFDFGELEAGDPFIVMELLRGEPLSALLQREPRMKPLTAVGTLLPVASALVAAHAKGIVHRDLKPDNIHLLPNDAGALVPKLFDFGIARLIDSDIERRLTVAGSVLGSPDYMSPEQARGEVDVSESTDIWAFSVVLYEAITGRRPFSGPNYNALILAVITAEPLTTLELGAGDADLWAILRRGLAKEVSERWPSMSEMAAALATWARERGLREDAAGTSLKSYRQAAARRASRARDPLASMPPSQRAPSSVRGSPAPEEPARPPFMAGRKPWIAGLAVVVLAVIGLLAYASNGPGPGAEGAPVVGAPAVGRAAPAPAPAPVGTVAAPSMDAPSSSAPPPPPQVAPGTFRPPSKRAPSVPDDLSPSR